MNKWTKVTESDEKQVNDGIDFLLTNRDRDAAVMCRLDIIAMKAHREPEGLTVTESTWEEFQAAREAFRHAY